MSDYADPIVRLYDTVFDRAPDAPGLQFWDNALHQGYSLHDISAEFVTAPEFAATYGQPDSATFVAEMYHNVLGRDGETGGMSFWTHNLDHGLTDRADIVVAFSESAEHIAHLAAPAAAPVAPAPEPVVTPAPAPAPVVVAMPAPEPAPAPGLTPSPGAFDGGVWFIESSRTYNPQTLVGHPGNNYIVGGPGDDIIWGGSGRNAMDGGPGNDTIHGGPGDDRIYGGEGNDMMFGGGGANVFAYTQNAMVSPLFGHDYIGDFQLGIDLLDFSGLHANYRGQGGFVADGQPQIRFEDNWTVRHEANAHLPGGSLVSFDANGDAVADATVSVFNVLLTDASFLV